MTTVQWVVLAGALGGLGLALVVWRLVPAYPNLAQTLAMLNPLAHARPERPATGWEAVGTWGLAKLPERIRPIPVKDLALLGVTPAGFLARKIAYGLVGLVMPAVLSAVWLLVGGHLPWVVPTLGALVLAAVAFLLPDLDIRSRAARARRDFSRALASYVDLVALERSCGSGTRQSLVTAAAVGDSWAFRRIGECLERTGWAGLAGWDGLRELATELDLTDLSDVADIMRLSGSEGAGVYRILRAKARSLREGLLTYELTRANETNEKMSLPVSVLGIVFLAILITPALLTMLGSLG